MARINWESVVAHAATIVNSYETGVTLRQLFYRLVSAELIPNSQNAYVRLSKVTAIARRAGEFPDLIDNTRAILCPPFWDDPGHAVNDMIRQYRRDRTAGQEFSIYVGVEKNALRTQIAHWFDDKGIPVLPFGGYPSQTFVSNIIEDIDLQGRPAVLLYGGDFDATGVDILRDFRARTAGCWAEIERIALNQSQITEYKLPPLPGKPWDPRAAAFEAAYGKLVQVELDALPPDVLKKIYEDAVDNYWDSSLFDEIMKKETEDRKRLLTPDKVASLVYALELGLQLGEQAVKLRGKPSKKKIADWQPALISMKAALKGTEAFNG